MSETGREASRPTLLVLASTYPRWEGDTEPGFVHELCRRMTSDFHVIALCPHAHGALEREFMDGVEVIRYRYAPSRWERLVNDGGIVTNLRRHRWMLALVPGFVLMQAWHAWRLMRKRKIDVMHAHWLIPQGLIAALVPFFTPQAPPFVVTSHGADLYALRGAALEAVKRFVVRRSAAASVVSEAMREKLFEIGADTRKVKVLPMGVDLVSRFTPSPTVARSVDEILFVGRLVEKKGLTHLVAVLRQVLDKFPQARLTVAGFGPDAESLAAQVRASGLCDSVTFLGAVKQDELPALYRRAAIFVAPFVQAASGDQEGLPVALMEALGCGCPVVVGHVAGIEDIFGVSTAELTVDPKNHDALAARIVEALADPERARAHALRIRGQLRDRLDWNRIAERYAALLRNAAPG
ncbi:glycosyltransferase [Variovorax sp. J31P207]|uniref:glycosyltransferase n=1 Tax=Variovorax sp. J31P207 TaxID=3053510 RepID=UPI002574D794|nr:glycosyltransferase [Variovorax sp. J31P207]MDM0065644.1 glycosyltransferase [Variovorax sp. J31P207]